MNYTPDEFAVRGAYNYARGSSADSDAGLDSEFDRFLAKIKADALRDAARTMRGWVDGSGEHTRFTEHALIEHGVERVLNEYADRIERSEA